ncbi:hypothetical protein B0H11DRAFT_2224192 [Mycena galericulata]|nr:hypothetical protein B0H11DRAFT_2224192 [Mycena galericulata]
MALHCGGKRSVATILHRAPSGSSSNTISTFELLRPGDTTRVAPHGSAQIDSNRRRTYARRDKDIRVPVRPIDESKISFQCIIDSNRRRTYARRDKDIRVPDGAPLLILPLPTWTRISFLSTWCECRQPARGGGKPELRIRAWMDTAADPRRSRAFTASDTKDVRVLARVLNRRILYDLQSSVRRTRVSRVPLASDVDSHILRVDVVRAEGQ